MRIRKLIAGLAALAMAMTGLAAVASSASAQVPDTTCTFAGTVDLNPGVSPLPPYPSGTYDFDSVFIVCVGRYTFVGSVDSTGTYNGSGGFSGNIDSAVCDGTVAGTRTGPVLVGSANTNCGSGPLAALFVPAGVNTGSLLINRAVVTGAVVLL